ncbi:class I lanthipeptide [Chitinophaga qingshengii]|uniref:Class I lanthipeptide n=1 Tax=Chitinophaga qingshengii TaxID=1569794 RepID=A0ABR7TUQ3_9BACT|nr:class I lanthipeptide [Chitinophaga qingshengii]MBC9934216.1 class I lanthipeptide [Chitinophaga qingshengii]
MKKKKIELAKKLTLAKAPVAALTGKQQGEVKGGFNSQYCDTYDPQWTCESNPRPGMVCM